MTPSIRLRMTALWIQRSKIPLKSVGSRKNRPTENRTPRNTEKDTTAFSSFSLPSFCPSHCSNLDGCASASSSGKNSAEYMSAFTPDTIDEAKFTTPRISGHLAIPVRFLSGSTFLTRPSGPRTTIERLSGPCIIMPSISA